MGLIEYSGPGDADPSLGGRFQKGPGEVATVLGKRVREEATEDEVEDEVEDEEEVADED